MSMFYGRFKHFDSLAIKVRLPPVYSHQPKTKTMKSSFPATGLTILFYLFAISANTQASTLYWFGADSTQGGDGSWTSSASNWSSTTPGKTTPGSPPSLSDTAVFAGSEGSNIVSLGTSSQGAGTVQVDTSGYVFEFTNGINWNVNSFSGSQLSNATIQAAGVYRGQIMSWHSTSSHNTSTHRSSSY